MMRRGRGLLCCAAAFSLLWGAGCRPEAGREKDSDLSEIQADGLQLRSEDFSLRLEGKNIYVAFEGEAEIPGDTVPVYAGDLYTFSGREELERLAALCISDYEDKKARMTFETSAYWGEMYQLKTGEDAIEKVQFVDENIFLYYRTPVGKEPVSEEMALRLAEEFAKTVYPEFFSRKTDCQISRDADTGYFDLVFQRQTGTGESGFETNFLGVFFAGDDRAYQAEQIKLSVDGEGVYSCTNTPCFKQYEVYDVLEGEEWLRPQQVMGAILEWYDLPYGSDYEIKEMELFYVPAPIKGEDAAKRLRLIPVWGAWGAQYPDPASGAVQKEAGMACAVDAANGEIYTVLLRGD